MKRALPPLTLLLVACTDPGPIHDTGHAMDWDVDGWFGRDDCDDQDASVHPDAEEVCDGVDNDCDGLIDEDFEESRPWYADQDEDGYGDAMSRLRGCEQPPGFVADHSDCDDQDASVHPGADDSWYDGVDGDCAGDDDHDADADGYSWEGTGGADCDDQDASIHPGVPDWTDGLDRDCDGVVDATRLLDEPAAVFGSFDAGQLGAALATVPDQDGDGVEDLLIGNPGVGAAWLVAGPVTGATSLPAGAIARLWGRSLEDRTGSALARAGDTDGDGDAELLVGAWLAGDGRGVAYLVEGPIREDRDLVTAPWQVEGESPGDYLGYALAGAGDTDGDGFDELIIGARGWSDRAQDAGAAWLIHGGAAGPEGLATAALVLGTRERDFAGSAVAGPGDLSGDGLDDVVVGARGEDSGGGAFVLLGPLEGVRTLDSAEGRLQGAHAYDYAGWALAGVGDTDGDGYRDLLVGAYGYDSFYTSCGVACLIMGRGDESWASLESLDQAEVSYVGERSYDRAGWSVAGPGDVDGDGRADLLIGAPGADLGGEEGGVVYLLLEPSEGVTGLGEAALRLRGEEGDAVGGALAPTSDHDQDGLPELFLGLPGHGASGQGAAWIVTLQE